MSVELTDAAMRSQQGRILAESLILAIAGFLLTAWMAARMAKGVTGPILALKAAVQRIQDGDLQHRVGTGAVGASWASSRQASTPWPRRCLPRASARRSWPRTPSIRKSGKGPCPGDTRLDR